MAKRVCCLSETEANALNRGEKLNCRFHRHVTREEAQALTSGSKYKPWLGEDVNYAPEARWAVLTDGRRSKKHIVILDIAEWKGRSSGGYQVLQLVKTRGKKKGKKK